VHDEAPLVTLAAPWSLARGYAVVLVEVKMPGDHLDWLAVERAVLRLHALRVQRGEGELPGREILWIVAPHVPRWLKRRRKLRRVGPGCYAVGPSWAPIVWVTANELPLRDELIPFLVARSGRALDRFARWVAPRRPLDWVLNMVEYTSMSTTVREELLRKFAQVDDPTIEARHQEILHALLEASPKVQQQLIDKGLKKGLKKGRTEGRTEGQLIAARAALRRVLARRQLALTPAEHARIDACDDLATLERWHDQAVTAASLAEALR
jgi:hypothetical protein